MNTTEPMMPIVKIQIGKRARKSLRGIQELAASIEAIGLMHPVVVRPDGQLVCGAQRLAAYRDVLKRDQIPVRILDIDALAHGERDENVCRVDFTPSEAVEINDAVLDEERHLAKQRMVAAHASPAKFAELGAGNARNKAARGTGLSHETIRKARAVKEAAEAEPENPTIQKIFDAMERSGRVNGPYKRLVVHQKAREIRHEPPPLPSRGPYRVIVADPPWPYELRTEDPSHRGTTPYPQMSIEQICGLDVASIAHEDAILWLWTTNLHICEAHAVLAAWSFEKKTILTWAKDRMGTGDWLRGQTEQCIFATRGKPTVQLTNQTTLLRGEVRAHSQKPESFYELVESLCPAPRYAELFQRTTRPGWDGHGDEISDVA